MLEGARVSLIVLLGVTLVVGEAAGVPLIVLLRRAVVIVCEDIVRLTISLMLTTGVPLIVTLRIEVVFVFEGIGVELIV